MLLPAYLMLQKHGKLDCESCCLLLDTLCNTWLKTDRRFYSMDSHAENNHTEDVCMEEDPARDVYAIDVYTGDNCKGGDICLDVITVDNYTMIYIMWGVWLNVSRVTDRDAGVLHSRNDQARDHNAKDDRTGHIVWVMIVSNGSSH